MIMHSKPLNFSLPWSTLTPGIKNTASLTIIHLRILFLVSWSNGEWKSGTLMTHLHRQRLALYLVIELWVLKHPHMQLWEFYINQSFRVHTVSEKDVNVKCRKTKAVTGGTSSAPHQGGRTGPMNHGLQHYLLLIAWYLCSKKLLYYIMTVKAILLSSATPLPK